MLWSDFTHYNFKKYKINRGILFILVEFEIF